MEFTAKRLENKHRTRKEDHEKTNKQTNNKDYLDGRGFSI